MELHQRTRQTKREIIEKGRTVDQRKPNVQKEDQSRTK